MKKFLDFTIGINNNNQFMNMNTMHIVILKNFQQTMSVDKKTHQACITYHLKKKLHMAFWHNDTYT